MKPVETRQSPESVVVNPPLVIETRNNAGVWEARFNFRPAKGPNSSDRRSRLQEIARKPYPEKNGTLQVFDVRVAETAEGVGAAVHLIREKVDSWPIGEIQIGETTIRARGRMTPCGIQDNEVAPLMEAIARRVPQS